MIRRRPLLAAAAATALFAPHLSRAANPEKFTVILDWLLDANHAGLFAAQQTGAFTRAGLDVTLVSPSDPDSPCRLVAAGQADLAISYGSQINLIASAGLPVIRIATIVGTPLNTIMALAGGAIKTLADLRGKTIGYSVAGVEEAILAAMLATAGVTPAEVTTVKVNYDMVAALLTHRLDAATGAYRNAEIIQVQQMGRTPLVFLPEQHGVPPYDELILVARADRQADPRLPRFIAALAEGVAAVQKTPDLLWQQFIAAHPEMDSTFNHLSWQASIPLLAANPGRLDAPRYLAFQQFAVAHGIISHALPLDRFAVQLVG